MMERHIMKHMFETDAFEKMSEVEICNLLYKLFFCTKSR